MTPTASNRHMACGTHIASTFRAGWGLLLWSALSTAEAQDNLNALLARTTPPEGVVIEIVTGQGSALNWAIPEANRQIQRLRAKFPTLDVIIVTHGSEQFALTQDNREQFRELHARVQQLQREQGVPVHVCGTHASWRDLAPEDFPSYVNVSDSGPSAINKYRELGYALLVISRRDALGDE